MTNKNDKYVKEIAIKFLKDKQKKLVKNFQTDIFSLEQTGEYVKYKTDDNYFKALNLSKGIDEILKDLEVLEIIKKHIINDRVAYLGWEDLEKNEYEIIKEWLENMMADNYSKLIEKIGKEYRELQDRLFLVDVIAIYNGEYTNDYEIYLKKKNDEIANARVFNPNDYSFKVEPIVLSQELFNFLIDLGN